MNQRKIGALLSYLNIFLTIAAQFVYTPIMLRILGQNEYGVYSLSESVIAYLSLLNFGFSGSYLKFYAQYKAENDYLKIKKLNAIYLIVFIAIALLIGAGGYALVQNVELIVDKTFTAAELRLTKVLMAVMTVNMAFMMPNNAFTSITVAHEKFIFAKGLTLLKNIGNPLFSLPVLLLGYGSEGMSYVLLILSIISLLLNVYYCKRKLQIGFVFHDLDWSVLKEIFSFSVFIFIWSIVDQLNWQIGKLLLANMIGSAAVATYTIGMQFTQLFMVFSTAIAGVFNPQIYACVYENDAAKKLTSLMIKVGRLQFYIVFFIWLGFVVFGRQFINLWAGYGYEDSYLIGLLLMTPLIIDLVQNVGIEILRAYNKHQINTMLHLLLAVLNVFISMLLIKYFGAVGCAMGSCVITFISKALISNYFYSKVIHLDIKAFFRDLCKFIPATCILAVFAVGFIIFTDVKTWMELIGYGFIFGIIYVFVMTRFAVNDYEMDLLGQFMRKILRPLLKIS